MERTVAVRQINPDDRDPVEQFKRWAAGAKAAPIRGATECGNLVHSLSARSPAAVNYGVYVGANLVGGIGTSDRYFNVMWLHWDSTQQGIGPQAAYAVLLLQFKRFGEAIVNDPNEKMCKALMQIMTPARRANVDCRRATSAIPLAPGDIIKPSA